MSTTRERIAKGSVSLLWALAGIALIAITWELTKNSRNVNQTTF